MLFMLRQKTWDFTAKLIGDLGKNVLTAGFASYFFKELPLPTRIFIAIIGLGLIYSSIYIMNKKGAE